jgi:hypothetical protein
VRKPVSVELQKKRRAAYEQVADEVSGALVAAGLNESQSIRHRGKPRYAGQKSVGERLGRDMRRTLYVLQKGDSDTTISTLSDIAHATGRRLVIRLEESGVPVDRSLRPGKVQPGVTLVAVKLRADQAA